MFNICVSLSKRQASDFAVTLNKAIGDTTYEFLHDPEYIEDVKLLEDLVRQLNRGEDNA